MAKDELKKIERRTSRPKKYTFRTTERLFDILVDLSNESDVCINKYLEDLIYREYWRLRSITNAQVRLGDE